MPQEIIEARPTKKLFIETLTLDVGVEACILDLIDNSVDSYVRLKIQDRRQIVMNINSNTFYLFDDCGGISKAYLKTNVFRFGNINSEFKEPTLGMYGIGLKRSIFKLGRTIVLTTDDGVDYSKVEIDVDSWQLDETNWTIPFDTGPSQLTNGQRPYTIIEINDLHEDVKEKLGLIAFQNALAETISRVYCIILKEHIDIKLNTEWLKGDPLLVPQSDENSAPQIHIEEHDEINIEIICFIDPSKGKRLPNAVNQVGWNLFCNRRLILANDTKAITGWRGGDEVKDKSMLPKYHSIFNEFRGLVFLSSNNPLKLPLNTSKTNFNVEHKNYNYILNKMVLTARPIIDFLSTKYSEEKQKEEEIESQIEEKSDEEKLPEFKEINELVIKPSEFRAPKRSAIAKPKNLTRISYTKEKDVVNRAMEYLNVSTPKEVGEKTFEYFIKMEDLNNE